MTAFPKEFGEWIQVDDQLPTSSEQDVLVAIRSDDGAVVYGLCTYDAREEEGERWIGVESLEPAAGTVTHWMPLPALPPLRRKRRTR